MAQRSSQAEPELAVNAASLADCVVTVLQSASSPFAKEKIQVRLIIDATSIQFWKKSRKKPIVSIPLSLCWTDTDIQLSKRNKDLDQSCCFEVVLPSQRWPLLAKTESERNKLLQCINDSIKSHLKIDQVPSERKGMFDFGGHVGVYDGEWLVGQPHGRGRFTCPDGTVYDGHWSSSIAAGYGVVISAGQNGEEENRAAGWETFFPDESPREAHNDVLDSNDLPSGLTDSDVQMLISHGLVRRYSKGDVILHEGEVNDCLYRIKSGIIRLTQEVNGQTQPRAEMGPEQMFGEMSVLDKNIISATVVAASDLVELYTIDLDVLYELFKTCPGFSKRFHHAMAETLAARLMRFFEPKGSRALRQTFSGPLGGPSDFKLAHTWMDVWNTRGKTSQCYLDLIEYRDPWVPNGVHGKHALQEHLKDLKESGRYWTWEDASVSHTTDGFRIISKVQLTSVRTNAVSRQDAVVEVTMNRKESKFKTITIRFDKDSLSHDQPVLDVRGGAESKSETTFKSQDIKYCHRFNLQEDETILCEKLCVLVNPSQSNSVSGTLYISQQYLCFYSKVFDMKTKEVVPIKAIKSVKTRPTSNGILVKYNVKTARKIARAHAELYHTGFDKNLELLFTFPTDFDLIAAEVTSLISKSGASLSKDSKSGAEGSDVAMDGYRVVKESVIQKFAKCSNLPEMLPSFPIRRSMNEQGVRVMGPNPTETAESYGSDLCGRTVSTYPRMSKLGTDGKVVLVGAERQGDPICDQFCIERMENKAIFAVADGCSWGAQPRRAAIIASRTFCEFVKHNLSQMTTVREAGKLFLHAFAAAHHRIVEGFEQQKIWDCGTTTLLGGAVLELAPSAQYVERRWGVVIASLGDCKGFIISSRYKTVVDMTAGSRQGSASIDASDCGGRLGPHVGEGNPDLRNMSLFYTPADEGDVVIFTSDGVFDNLDPQSFGILPSQLGLEGNSWDEQTDFKRVEEVKTAYVCEKIRELVFGPQRNEDEESSQSGIGGVGVGGVGVGGPSESIQPDDSLASNNALPTSTRPINLNVSEIVEKLIAHAITTTQSSRDFMESFPDKILPKDYKAFPGKLDHTTCVALKIKRATFKSVENELDSLVLRMRNPAQGLSTVKTPLGSLNLKASANADPNAQVIVPLTKGEGIESPRYKDMDPATALSDLIPSSSSSTTSTSSTSSTSPMAINNPSSALSSTSSSHAQVAPHASTGTGTEVVVIGQSAPSSLLDPPSAIPSSTSSSPSSSHTSTPSTASTASSTSGTVGTVKESKSRPTTLKRTNTILNVAIRGSVILRWLRENEKMQELNAAKVAQMLLGFRYIRPLDVENWKNETFSQETAYNFQVYEPIMTRNDWEQLLRASRRVTFPKETVIVKEGEVSKQRLYYIISGRCRTVKSISSEAPQGPKDRKRKDKKHLALAVPTSNASGTEETSTTTSSSSSSSSSGGGISPPSSSSPLNPSAPLTSYRDKDSTASSSRQNKLIKKSKVRGEAIPELKHDLEVSIMCENETFGEVSFLFSQKTAAKASASVVADSQVDLYIIEGSWINILFVKYPGMAGRFYHYLASVLAHRLKKQEILESQRTPSTP
jgi:CRP-like cAMP-binding protein